MSNGLRSQFRSLQRMHKEKQKNVVTDPKDSNLSKGAFEDTDDETLSSDQADLRASSPTLIHQKSKDDQVFLQMAISTAVSAQNEIDALMNGIGELEAIVNANQSSTTLARADNRSSVNSRGKGTCTTLVDDFGV
jgi:hypothetical protein